MSEGDSEPERALQLLARQLREAKTVISALVAEPGESPTLGLLAAAGPRAAAAPGAYAIVVESVREGYLLHYGQPRIVRGADPGLALLAGDYLYALGLDRLAAIGDQEAIRELADLISLSAQLNTGDAPDHELADWLWIAAVVAITTGPSERFDWAKQAVRSGDPGALPAIHAAAGEGAKRAGMNDALGEASEAIHFSG